MHRPSALLASCAVLLAMPRVAHANLMLFPNGGTDPSTSIVTKKSGAAFDPNHQIASGSGAGDGIMSMNAAPGGQSFESGGIAPNSSGFPVATGDVTIASNPCGPSNCTTTSLNSNVPTIAQLGWTTNNTATAPVQASQVGIGLAINQSGGTGLTLQTLVMQLYVSGTGVAIGSPFTLATPITYPGTLAGGLTGNAKVVSLFDLSNAELNTFDDLVDANGGPTNVQVGLSFSAGCGKGAKNAVSPFVCQIKTNTVDPNQPANDGVEQLLNAPTGLVESTTPPIIPLPTTLPLFASGLAVVGLLGWRRKRKSAVSVL